MGKQPITFQENLQDLRRWMKTKGDSTLEDISLWRNGDWEDRRLLNLPQGLVPQWKTLISHLKGVAPFSMDTKDSLRWDPNGGAFLVKSRYATLNQQGNSDWEYWREARKIESLPKIKVFMWILLKGKILTTDNLKKNAMKVIHAMQCVI